MLRSEARARFWFRVMNESTTAKFTQTGEYISVHSDDIPKKRQKNDSTSGSCSAKGEMLTAEGVHVLVVARGTDNTRSEVMFQLKPGTRWEKLMQKWCQSQKIRRDDAQFFCGGRKMYGWERPIDYGIQSGGGHSLEVVRERHMGWLTANIPSWRY